ncbi:MAG: BtpA/SgcQ family protein [Planctomycetes bacterium]|nr:BtpA/SgcQ family protein [Planctomycetota bacterium]MCC7172966.1 BtpA/SgcQ family protein [Planctomycetota bacterium]
MTATWFSQWFPRRKPVIGVVHLGPLPGSPRFGGDLDAVLERAAADADAYVKGGADGLLVENFGDAPFFATQVPAITVAAMTRAAVLVVSTARGRPVGVNVLRNDGASAVAVATAAGAAFVRVNVLSGVYATDQGVIESDAARVMRLRAELRSPVRVFADVSVKHATPLRNETLEREIADVRDRALADAILVTGAATGAAPDVKSVARAKLCAGSAPVLVASGVAPSTLAGLDAADGFIVGTALKRGGKTDAAVDKQRVAALVRAVRAL